MDDIDTKKEKMLFEKCIKFLLTELKGCTRPEVAGVRPKRDEIRTKTTEYPPLRLDQARLLSSLWYGTRTKLFLFWICWLSRTKYAAHGCFREDGPNGKIRTK